MNNDAQIILRTIIMKDIKEDRFIVSVRVGPKGQITIPAEARKMFDIKVGDTLMIMGDKERGLAILKDDAFYTLMKEMMPDGSNKN